MTCLSVCHSVSQSDTHDLPTLPWHCIELGEGEIARVFPSVPQLSLSDRISVSLLMCSVDASLQ